MIIQIVKLLTRCPNDVMIDTNNNYLTFMNDGLQRCLFGINENASLNNKMIDRDQNFVLYMNESLACVSFLFHVSD